MTKKQVEHLTLAGIAALHVGEDYGIDRLKEIMAFLRAARDLYLIDNKKMGKIAKEIGDAMMAEHNRMLGEGVA